MPEQVSDFIDAFYLYIGITTDKKHQYILLNSLDENDGMSIYTKTNPTYTHDKKVFKYGNIGSIFAVSFDGKSINYKKDATPKAFWSNKEDRAKWQMMHNTNEVYVSIQKENSENEYKKILEPIKELYQKSGYRKRTIILAEIIRIITT